MALSIGLAKRVSQYLKLLVNCWLEQALLKKTLLAQRLVQMQWNLLVAKAAPAPNPRFHQVQSKLSEEHLLYLHRHSHCTSPMSCGTLSKASVPREPGNVWVVELR